MNRNQNTQSSDARIARRERTFLKAKASYSDGAMSTPCTVVQISETGARLNIDASFVLPDLFDIEIPQRSITCRAKVVWRDQTQVGVEFMAGNVPALASAEDYLVKIRKLEELNAKFKAQVAELASQVRRLTEEA